jgi:dihydrofolate reductase
MNSFPNYVASTTLEEPLSWSNSTLLKGDAADAVAGLKEQPGKDLVILGSGELVQSLMRRRSSTSTCS